MWSQFIVELLQKVSANYTNYYITTYKLNGVFKFFWQFCGHYCLIMYFVILQGKMDAFVLLKFTLLIVTIFNGSDARSIKPQCKRLIKEGLFNGKDFITFSEYLNTFIKGGYKLTPNQVHDLKIDFDKSDINGDEMLDLGEMAETEHTYPVLSSGKEYR